jgi:hypothetical protein
MIGMISLRDLMLIKLNKINKKILALIIFMEKINHIINGKLLVYLIKIKIKRQR